jgi:hypothetical protein
MSSTVASATDILSLRTLLVRVWGAYLAKRRLGFFVAAACAILAGVLNGVVVAMLAKITDTELYGCG